MTSYDIFIIWPSMGQGAAFYCFDMILLLLWTLPVRVQWLPGLFPGGQAVGS